MSNRNATVKRTTRETEIELSLNLDGRGTAEADTGVGFLDHMLDHLAKHSLSDLAVACKGDVEVDDHHSVEDIAIALGEALAEALGDKAGIRRYGCASVPMDEALATATLDISGRATLVFDAPLSSGKIGQFDAQLIEEFLRALVRSARVTLHVQVPYGSNDHHIAEAVFKAVAQALRQAKAIDPDRVGEIPSTKGVL